MKHLGDITKIDWFSVEPVDVVTGGSPCQDLSVAGKRAGLAGERSGLFMEQIRCVKELRKADELRGRTSQFIRPRYMVWENVPGAFSSGNPKGADFGAVLEEIAKVCEPEAPPVSVPQKGWPSAGCLYDDLGRWSIAWRVHDAQFWGVPQRRKRIALVADFGGLSAPEVLFERKGLSGNFESCIPEREAVAEGTEGCVGAADCEGNCVIAIDQQGGKGGANYAVDVMPTICSDSHGTPHAVAYCGNKGIGINGEVASTLDASYYKGCGNNQSVVAIIDSIGGQSERSWVGEICSTLKATHYKFASSVVLSSAEFCPEQSAKTNCMHDPMAVMVTSVDCRNGYENTELSGTIQEKENGGQSLNYINPVRLENTVRRLTPLECERLQGYPDGWTDIGEWIDSKGKKHKEADSPRYKALGNSIALPFWKYLLKRISAQYERDATIGSLFDGIGGFPLCWEQINGKGSARWASEIEEFPMAVTKIRFGED